MKRVGLVLFSMVAIALICSGSALAQGDNSTYFVTYYANNVSGAPDATVRAINDGSAGAYGGNLFADFGKQCRSLACLFRLMCPPELDSGKPAEHNHYGQD